MYWPMLGQLSLVWSNQAVNAVVGKSSLACRFDRYVNVGQCLLYWLVALRFLLTLLRLRHHDTTFLIIENKMF